MSRTESTYSERIGARISPELKARLQALVDDGYFESEADAVREALWQFAEQSDGEPRLPSTTHADGRDMQAFESRLEWLFSVLFILLAVIGSRILNAVGGGNIKPATLVDEAIQETIYNQALLRERLDTGHATAQQHQPEEIDAGVRSGQ